MKKVVFAIVFFFLGVAAFNPLQAQPLKPRPDAFPWKPDTNERKGVSMASTVEQMASWDRYPTYDTYLNMMQAWASEFPTLCHVDTIGTSIQGRLILSMYIEIQTVDELYRPEFFYSSTMHGDEVTGFVMMLRLIDTLLHGYGNNPQYTNLINRTRISINPLSNPDGTYHGGNNTVRFAWRYNANWVDLNRNFPDPFGTAPMDDQQPENTAMIDYVSNHNFKLSANLHGGAEVMNYPWDSYTSAEYPHPDRDWWIGVSKRFVDTSRTYSNSHFLDTYNSGYTAGGDWYVIHNGRQDFMNDSIKCREMTMEISSEKMIDSEQLPEYWSFLQHSLVNYIEEIHNFYDTPESIDDSQSEHSATRLSAYPNPTRDRLFLSTPAQEPLYIFNMRGQCVLQFSAGTTLMDLQPLPKGIYLLRSGDMTAKIVKQ